MKTGMVIFCLALCSWGAFAQHDQAATADDKKMEQGVAAFKDAHMGEAYVQYVLLKDALVASNGGEAKKRASELEKALKVVSGSNAAGMAASTIGTSDELKEQRKTFSVLINEMATLVKGGKLSAGMLYLDYCPMANGNTGAFWLSNEKEIKNPYFGDKMLKCGSVKEMIH